METSYTAFRVWLKRNLIIKNHDSYGNNGCVFAALTCVFQSSVEAQACAPGGANEAAAIHCQRQAL